jgi:hypothetical protein
MLSRDVPAGHTIPHQKREGLEQHRQRVTSHRLAILRQHVNVDHDHSPDLTHSSSTNAGGVPKVRSSSA